MAVTPQIALPIAYQDATPQTPGTPLNRANLKPNFDAIVAAFNIHTHPELSGAFIPDFLAADIPDLLAQGDPDLGVVTDIGYVSSGTFTPDSSYQPVGTDFLRVSFFNETTFAAPGNYTFDITHPFVADTPVDLVFDPSVARVVKPGDIISYTYNGVQGAAIQAAGVTGRLELTILYSDIIALLVDLGLVP